MILSLKYRKVFITGVLILLFFMVDDVVSQPTHIRGAVLDIETGKPIPAVHVYISQTTAGTITKHDGTFEFSTNLSGAHTLVFSYVGYKTEIREINFYTDKRPYFEVKLSPDPVELAPLEVTSSNKEWQKSFEIFRRNFIGATGVAKDTNIKNPWIINFKRDDNGNLLALADQPLEMINQALGYELKVDLAEFRWPEGGEPGYYLFYISFSELEPENNREMRRWERNRRNIYEGSFQHFLKNLYENNLKRSDFKTVLAGTNRQIEITQLDYVSRSLLHLHSSIEGLKIDEVKAYQLKHPVDIVYGRRWFNNNRQRSRIVPMDREGIFLVTNQARLANPLSLRLDGVWSKHRVAHLLPVNYSLGE